VTSPTHRTATPAMWADKPMPDGERRALGAATAAVWLFALAVNVDHVERHLRTGGASPVEVTWLRWAPDVLLLVGAWKLRYRPRSVIAWSMLGLGVAWLAWAGLSMAAQTATGRIVSLLPILVALLMTLALEFKHAEEPAPATGLGISPPESKPEPRSYESPAAQDASPASMPAPSRKESAKGAPSREEARAILMALEDFEAVSNGHLSREHGCSDVWWGRQKKALRAELAELTTEANAPWRVSDRATPDATWTSRRTASGTCARSGRLPGSTSTASAPTWAGRSAGKWTGPSRSPCRPWTGHDR
jgi:hypothetical protein